MLQSLHHLHGPLLDSVQYVHALYWGAKNWAQYSQLWPHQCYVELKDHLPQPVGNSPPYAAQDTISPLCCKGALLAYGQVAACQDPWVLFRQAVFQLISVQHILVPFPFWNFMGFLSGHFSVLLRSLSMAAGPSGISTTPPRFVSSENFLREHSAPSSRSIKKMLNRTGPTIDPWCTLLVTGFQLDFVPLIMTLWAWRFNYFWVYLTVFSFSPYFNSLSVKILRDIVENLTEVKVDNIHCSLLVYQASHFGLEKGPALFLELGLT